MVDRLNKAGRSEATQHARVYRPWGFFETLHLGPGTQVKLIEVNPGAALSLQYHHKRAEHWVVVSGEASVVRISAAGSLDATFGGGSIPLGSGPRWIR